VTPEEAKMAEEIRQKLDNLGRRFTIPSLGEFVTLQVPLAPSAPLGNREIRLDTPGGFSSPHVFHVGELPEVSKQDWKNIPTSKGSMDPALDPKPPEEVITLPVTLNGQIPPGSLHRYRFSARKGQRLVVAVRARELIPYISDAAPGCFRATIALLDAHGQEVAYADDFQFRLDPVLFCEVPADGVYLLEIKDALYRGREDFVYRITIGELPFLTGIFLLGGAIGSQTTVAASGWNPPFNQLPLDLPDMARASTTFPARTPRTPRTPCRSRRICCRSASKRNQTTLPPAHSRLGVRSSLTVASISRATWTSSVLKARQEDRSGQKCMPAGSIRPLIRCSSSPTPPEANWHSTTITRTKGRG
jgi:hypothetical protein